MKGRKGQGRGGWRQKRRGEKERRCLDQQVVHNQNCLFIQWLQLRSANNQRVCNKAKNISIVLITPPPKRESHVHMRGMVGGGSRLSEQANFSHLQAKKRKKKKKTKQYKFSLEHIWQLCGAKKTTRKQTGRCSLWTKSTRYARSDSIQYIHTCCQSIPHSNTKQHFAFFLLFTLRHCGFHPQEDRACIY